MTTAEYTGRRRAPAPNVEGVEVGDIFYASWGYDQTNIDYYVVVALTPKRVKIRAIGTQSTGEDRQHVIPDPTRFLDEGAGWCPSCRQRVYEKAGELRHRQTDQVHCIDADGFNTGNVAEPVKPTIHTKTVRSYGGKPTLAWTSYASLYLWDGSPNYQTPFGEGH